MNTFQSKRHKVGLEYDNGWWNIYIDDKYRCRRSDLYYAIRALDNQFSIPEAREYLFAEYAKLTGNDNDDLF